MPAPESPHTPRPGSPSRFHPAPAPAPAPAPGPEPELAAAPMDEGAQLTLPATAARVVGLARVVVGGDLPF